MGLSQTNCNKETLLRLPVRLFAPHPDPVAAPKEILLLLVGHVPCLLLILGHGRFKFNGYNKIIINVYDYYDDEDDYDVGESIFHRHRHYPHNPHS